MPKTERIIRAQEKRAAEAFGKVLRALRMRNRIMQDEAFRALSEALRELHEGDDE